MALYVDGLFAVDRKMALDLDFISLHWLPLEVNAGSGSVRYSCEKFDDVHRVCGAYAQRPPVCSGFPWYSRPAGELGSISMSPRCSFWLDVDPSARPPQTRPLIPVTVLGVAK